MYKRPSKRRQKSITRLARNSAGEVGLKPKDEAVPGDLRAFARGEEAASYKGGSEDPAALEVLGSWVLFQPSWQQRVQFRTTQGCLESLLHWHPMCGLHPRWRAQARLQPLERERLTYSSARRNTKALGRH